jgi:glycosyltransferase involved in cell wall biosynthesis
LKIVQAIHQFLPKNVAGSEIYTYRLSKELARRGHSVHVVFSEVVPDREQGAVDEGEYDGLPFTRIVCNYRFRSFEETYRSPAVEAIFDRVLRRERPDVLHLQHLQSFSWGVPAAAKRLRVPVVFTLHEYHLLCLRGGQLLRADRGLCRDAVPEVCAGCVRERFAHLEIPRGGANPEADAARARLDAARAIVPFVDRFVSPSAFLRDTFVRARFPEDRILVSDNGLDPAPFRERPPRRRQPGAPIRFGFVGSLVEWKGVHVAIEALNALERDGWEFHVFGKRFREGEHAAYVASLERAATNPRIRFRDAFAPADVARVFSEIDVLVVPSIWFENSPLTINEAFLSGVPVIASGHGGMAERVRDGAGGLQFRPGDAADLRRVAARFLDEPDLLPALAANAPRVKTIEENAREIEALYEEVRAARRTRGGWLRRIIGERRSPQR